MGSKLENLAKNFVLIRVLTAVKRHHDQSQSYKGQHLIGMAYRFRALIINVGAEQHLGRHSAGSAKSFTSSSVSY